MDGSSVLIQGLENSANKERVSKSAREPYTVFPPCVVHNIHEVAPYLSASTKLGAAAETVTFSKEDSREVSGSKKQKLVFLSKISAGVSWTLETGFYKIGLFVGKYPILTITTLVIMCGLCGLGLKTFHETENQEKLWVPQTSRILPEKAWVDRTFPQETRFVSILAVQPKGNILSPVSINALMDYYVESATTKINGQTLTDMCVKVGPVCFVPSLLELWNYNETIIRSLSSSDIIHTMNKTALSSVSGVEIITLLGGEVTYDADGMIIAAEATQMTWVLEKEDNSNAAEWEKAMIDIALKGNPQIANTFVYATRSFDDEGYGAINNDIKRLAAGFSIVFVFIMLTLGKFNLMEQKIYLSLSGMACVGLSILVSYGVATGIGIIFSPIQSIMPFLLLGIGVDDMFVIVEAWKNLSPEENKLDVPEKLAVTLSKAGVSITVTSVTDIVAFGISATTVIPALSSFCIYAAIGIFALFILVSTVFAGVLALDERRRRARHDACIVCYRHPENYASYKWSTGKSMLHIIFSKYYGPLIIKLPVKIFIIVISVAIASVGTWRFILMPQDFDIVNYIPSDSYAYSYSRTKENYFTRQGMDTTLYCGGFDYFEERKNLQAIHDKILRNPYIQQGTVNSWFIMYENWLKANGKIIANSADYNNELYNFLHSSFGRRFASFVKFNSTTQPMSIVGTYFTMKHTRQETSFDDVKAMDALRENIDNSGIPRFTGEDMPMYMCFTYTLDYMSLETNKVLQGELYRNLGLSALCVFVVTLILIANLWTSLLVLLCVLFTVLDVGGSLELWGTTIDTASSILLNLAVGLAVDYSAHIGHTFMTAHGSRNSRVLSTMTDIGPAVFNGGLSTFLAFALLADSTSYGFQLFFRVFFTVVLFGLFHGLAFLPVLLSIFGPGTYKHEKQLTDSVAVYIKKQGMEKEESQQWHHPEKPMANGQEETSNRVCDGPIHTVYSQPDDSNEQIVYDVHSQPDEQHVYDGPIHTVYNQPDDSNEQRITSRVPVAAVTSHGSVPTQQYISVVDVNTRPPVSHISKQENSSSIHGVINTKL